MMSHDRVFIRWPLRDRLSAWGFVFIPTGDGALFVLDVAAVYLIDESRHRSRRRQAHTCAFGQEIARIATTSR